MIEPSYIEWEEVNGSHSERPVSDNERSDRVGSNRVVSGSLVRSAASRPVESLSIKQRDCR